MYLKTLALEDSAKQKFVRDRAGYTPALIVVGEIVPELRRQEQVTAADRGKPMHEGRRAKKKTPAAQRPGTRNRAPHAASTSPATNQASWRNRPA